MVENRTPKPLIKDDYMIVGNPFLAPRECRILSRTLYFELLNK